MDNKSLFWYGAGATVKTVFGRVLTLIGTIFSLVGLSESGAFIIGIPLLILGIYLWATGSSQRFDYKRQSGSIIHKGDF